MPTRKFKFYIYNHHLYLDDINHITICLINPVLILTGNVTLCIITQLLGQNITMPWRCLSNKIYRIKRLFHPIYVT